VSELVNIYHFPSLNKNTALYGLIGDPITNSQGHLYHNDVFTKKNLNAVYVKMNVKAEELSSFFPMAKKIGFRGLSVTMPLKEKFFSFLDHIDKKTESIGATNTIRIEKGKSFGTNTDGVGALDAIEKRGPVQDKNLVIIGAGGASKSIAFEALARGSKVWILNRTLQRAQELATLLQCYGGGLNDFPSHYDILINCSPDPMPINRSYILSHALVMDIVYVPRETLFLQEAALLGCPIIYGEEMFWNQAAKQTAYWLDT
jgi:3-dehydroquinate dehydratase/shikimate dehydrogenase